MRQNIKVDLYLEKMAGKLKLKSFRFANMPALGQSFFGLYRKLIRLGLLSGEFYMTVVSQPNSVPNAGTPFVGSFVHQLRV